MVGPIAEVTGGMGRQLKGLKPAISKVNKQRGSSFEDHRSKW